jgi:hypothetical protein
MGPSRLNAGSTDLKEEDKVITKSKTPLSGLALAVPLLLAGCAGANAQPKPPDRGAQVPLIIEEVLRYGIHQYAPKGDGAESPLCVAVRDGGLPMDPSPSIMRGLNNKQVQPKSECKAARTLIAGPIEWLRDDEVRVKGGYLRATEGEARFAYRVVRENGRWVCVGPIISSDPN